VCEESTPDPEYLIKSIAEQGYSLETSLADLIDNSISAAADKVEILIDFNKEPFTLFLADNGNGMDEPSLIKNIKFPSSSPDTGRSHNDLGRFGLGMKTASFSQTRCFTVLSRKKGTAKYSARTWDVDYLKENGWKVKVNTAQEIDFLISSYHQLSKSYLKQFDSFEANTIIVWNGLYKFEQYIEEGKDRRTALKKEITEVTSDYLSLVFHRFMDRKATPLQIRINNNLIKPFNPFPTQEKDFRSIEYKQRSFRSDVIKIEGFVLPSRSIDETKDVNNRWTTKNRSLTDMEGIYIYRADRIILFGGWLGVIKKGPKLQLARLRVEVGNSVDHLLHLNVAKSQITIPFELQNGFESYIEELKVQAEREFYNRGIKVFSNSKKENRIQLFERKASSKGTLLRLNSDFPILKSLSEDLSKSQLSKLNLIIRMVNTRINNIRQTFEDQSFAGDIEKDEISLEDLMLCIKQLKTSGLSSEEIKKEIIPGLGFKQTSLPIEIIELLK
jgi:hypothetical protein